VGVAVPGLRNWPAALVIVKPATVIAWHRRASAFSGGGKTVAADPAGPLSLTTFAN